MRKSINPNQIKATVDNLNQCKVPFKHSPTYWSADLDALKKGSFGLNLPKALNESIIAVAIVCSMYPSIGRSVIGNCCLGGGSLYGKLTEWYCLGSLYIKVERKNYQLQSKSIFECNFLYLINLSKCTSVQKQYSLVQYSTQNFEFPERRLSYLK